MSYDKRDVFKKECAAMKNAEKTALKFAYTAMTCVNIVLCITLAAICLYFR